MTADRFLKDKGWYAGSLMLSKTKGQGLVSITEAMEEYHQAKLKLLGIADVSQQRELLEWLSNEDYFNIPKDEISEILEDWQTYNSNCG